MKETWSLIFALALFLLRPFWLWRFWRATLKQGEGWFLGIEVEPGFIARLARLYCAVIARGVSRRWRWRRRSSWR